MHASDAIDLSSVYVSMESDGDNTFLAAVGWAYRLLLSPVTTQRVGSEGVSGPKSNGMDYYHDATP